MANENQQPLLPPEPWYTSEVQVRLVLAGLAQIVSIIFRTLPLFGVQIDVEQADLDVIFANVTQGLAGVFGILAIMKRQKSPIQPLTMTKAKAEARSDEGILDPATMKPKQAAPSSDDTA